MTTTTILDAPLPLAVLILRGAYKGAAGTLVSRWTRPDGELMCDVECGYGRPVGVKAADVEAAL